MNVLRLAMCVVLVAGTAGVAASRSVWSGVYTPEQAEAGEKVYYAQCASCHGDDLAGVERAPALVGAAFRDAWHEKTVRKLVERIETMPPDEPPVISLRDAADVTAFLLQASGMPAGAAPLPADRRQLADITFERTKP